MNKLRTASREMLVQNLQSNCKFVVDFSYQLDLELPRSSDVELEEISKKQRRSFHRVFKTCRGQCATVNWCLCFCQNMCLRCADKCLLPPLINGWKLLSVVAGSSLRKLEEIATLKLLKLVVFFVELAKDSAQPQTEPSLMNQVSMVRW